MEIVGSGWTAAKRRGGGGGQWGVGCGGVWLASVVEGGAVVSAKGLREVVFRVLRDYNNKRENNKYNKR